MNKSIKSFALFAVLVLFLASCKSQKAVVDTQPEPEVEEPTPTPEPEPEPEVEEPKDVRSAPEPTLDTRINNYFAAIANASSTDVANRNIREALGLFNNGNAPVLIIIYSANGTEDYDEPTDITKYLNYIKDTGNNVHRVMEVVRDPNGKIKELVLVKK
ncbi:nucleoid-structuring protein H-NS [Roseivirga sp.]|uniref:nucleoid-structuring protein H-NS n=1 Tax=Roseivirga sp. TaxID=1964215 RepID=UPI003B52035F